MSDGYKDRDDGDEVWYCGTVPEDEKASEPTKKTMSLVTSSRTGVPVRIFRSHGMRPTSQYRPRAGFRYDGLYKVRNYKILDHEKQAYQFHLTRLPGQTPIHHQGPEARPTDEEVNAFNNDKRLKKSKE